MTTIKGVRVLVEAVAAATAVEHPIHLLMAGEGPHRSCFTG
jgi:hypothetical protein